MHLAVRLVLTLDLLLIFFLSHHLSMENWLLIRNSSPRLTTHHLVLFNILEYSQVVDLFDISSLPLENFTSKSCIRNPDFI